MLMISEKYKMEKVKNRMGGKKGLNAFYLTIFVTVTLFLIFQENANSQVKSIDWFYVAKSKPELKVLIFIEGERPISLGTLAALSELGINPTDRDPAFLLGLKRGIFSARLKRWMNRPALPDHLKGRLLDRFIMNGMYRIGFKVEKEDYLGTLNLEVTTPREGFGKKLLSVESLTRPQGQTRTYADLSDNRWFCVDYPQVKYGQVIKLFFAFKYLVDMNKLLDHDLMLVDQFQDAPIPEEVSRFLDSGYKIDTALPQAIDWALRGRPGPLNVRQEYKRLAKFVKDSVVYDKGKRDQYFGGKMIYSDLDEMYQDNKVTLSRRLGACPDTSLLECAFLRARSIPCRIAGRFGHFYPLVYVPGRGWMSTSVTPTGIPLIVAPGPNHIPYQKWEPKIPLKTILLESQFRVETMED
jgi:hypothetical protein